MATSANSDQVPEEIHKTSQEEEGEETESETDSDDSEEDVEPKLRYDRVTNDLSAILNKDCASCMAVHSKFLALGTHWGTIHILDYLGNNIQGKEYQAHTTTVNQISVDDNGDYIASCSDDGKVNIFGLYSSEDNQVVNFDRPVKSVALDPEFYRSSSKQFVTGDDKLILNERGLFRSHKTRVLHQGEGAIRQIKWKGELIAWSNDFGVKVYDLNSRTRITSITKDQNHRPDLYQCNLHWQDDKRLLIGWADTVKVCLVKDRVGQDIRDLPARYVEIIAMFNTPEFMICGIASLENHLVLLTFDKNTQQEGGKIMSSRPNLRIVDAHMEYFEELSNDALSIRGYQNYRCNDYHLGNMCINENVIEDNLFYIISPKDVVVARPRDQDDHITWLIEHEDFEEAMNAATLHSKELKRHTFQDIGRQFLNYLIDQRRFEDAAKLCVKIFGKNKDLWEAEAYKFARMNQLKWLAPYLPKDDPRLSPAIYEMVLNDFLHTNCKVFLQLVKEWQCTLYNIQAIIKVVIDRLDRDRNNRDLLHALAELHGYERAFDKALAIYLKLKDRDVFVLIHKHNLFESVSDKIVQLMEFDQDAAVTMLLNNLDKIPVDKVVRQLEKRPKYLYVYLDKLAMKDQQSIKSFATQMVKLYAEYDRPKLLPFLRGSVQYNLDMALNEVKVREFKPELVFLLGRTGDMKTALQIIVDELHDVDQAIEFCKEHNDQELWEDLIHYSLDKPNFITGLLNNIGTHVDPIILIKRIRTGMEIPELRDSLVKILQDYNLQISLREGCKKILVADSFGLMNRLVKTQKKAISVDTSHVCTVCHERILVTETRHASDVIVFFCSHAAHELCLNSTTETCPICTTQRRGPGRSTMIRK
ncbi:vacuolar protein sorting-associated protein 41 homolog isoform X2 [Mercenaria mercenaria]|uniref:vacuolar protein sorting-associated protein 41 homolog isoform X2 n=1 Tax=Mercenaria mercenaria TaxID=6596 RepID=UPI00234EE81A|nr:vacuolar protein sorting-associated protein 41 homolog isoform X2 [Mercenaria mercenaria]